MTNIILALTIALAVVGCATHQPKYYWGHYEELIYDQYAEPGKATPEYQILKMEEDIQKARGWSLPLPPGFYAHLGYQYLLAGNGDEAKRAFETEKALYPESSKFLNRIAKKVK